MKSDKNDRSSSAGNGNGQETKKKNVVPTEDQGSRATQIKGANQYKFDNQDRTDKKKDVDAERYLEEQNIDPNEYNQNDKKNLNGLPKDQRI